MRGQLQLNDPKKIPQQNRSRSAVNAIVEACSRLLTTHGVAKTTTNRIAEKAGVSIGSLYQYFPNKDAIFKHVVDRMLDEEAARYIDLLADHKNYPPEEYIGLLVDRAVDVFFNREDLFRHVLRIAPKVTSVERTYVMRKKVADALAEVFNRNYPEVSLVEVKEATFLIVNAFLGNIQAYFCLEDQRIPKEQFRHHFCALAIGYTRQALDVYKQRSVS